MVSVKWWGKLGDKDIFLYTITNDKGNFVQLTNLGATIVQLVVPDNTGRMSSVVLGYPTLEGYLQDDNYMGATIGRFANRISEARFNLGSVRYQLEANDGPHCNHGGYSGLHKQVFDVSLGEDRVEFTFLSPDGAGGFPGKLRMSVTYDWNDLQELLISYQGRTNKHTVLNLTNHSYFNLSGDSSDMLSHQLRIRACGKLGFKEKFIPTGVILPITRKVLTGKNNCIKDDIQLPLQKGLNECYVLSHDNGNERPACRIWDEGSGRGMSVFTTYPGLVLYTGDYLKSEVLGHSGRPYKAYDGICLECQYFPDSPNQPGFPSTELTVADMYDESILYKFDLEPDWATN